MSPTLPVSTTAAATAATRTWIRNGLVVYMVLVVTAAVVAVVWYGGDADATLDRSTERFPNRVALMASDRCNEACLAALHAIHTTTETLDAAGVARTTHARLNRNTPTVHTSAAFATHQGTHGAVYPMVIEHDTATNRPHVYRFRVHPDTRLRDVRVRESTHPAAKAIRVRVQQAFDTTDADTAPYQLETYPWTHVDGTTGTTGTKTLLRYRGTKTLLRYRGTKTLLRYRYSDTVVVQAGYVDTPETANALDASTVVTCIGIYLSWVVAGFVWPGTFLGRTTDVFRGGALAAFLVALFVSYTYLMVMNVRTMRTKTSDDLATITNTLVQSRYSALGMVGLVLALGLFVEHCPEERPFVFPALFLSLVYALAAVLDVYTPHTATSLARRNHVRTALFVASVWCFVWLFGVLIGRTVG